MFGLGKKAKPAELFPMLFDEQEMLMGMLKNDPRVMSHVWGQEVYYLQHIERDDEKAQRRIDEILQVLCERYSEDPATLSRILRTMVKSYSIDIKPAEVSCFDRVYNIISAHVARNHSDIEEYQ